ncbi:M20 family metallopeptidase [Labrys monachus]|uniref:Glutamate carboxypeptidase n=1 Tax=Labrys monachus TaxID=217067 RepID=A0ABU0FII3_9HYPH|nr:M20 family metallopeptidase [Labrys monachus]MDQ0394417.1 glutamate carboxypeptidase [Labrys monachus]
MAGLAAAERRIVAWLAARESEMLSLLADIVNIDSGTRHADGVGAVAARLHGFFADHGLSGEAIAGPPFGNGLKVRVAGGNGPSALLMGHLDTVFPVGEAGRRPFGLAGGRAGGPGVADMKAGIVMNAFVLAAFQACGGHGGPLTGLFTGDEEVGSPAYRPLIEAEAAQADFAFNAEPGRPSGNVVVERRGGVFMRMAIKGKAAHSGIDVRAGISAVEELSHKVLALHALTDDRITVNVGVVSGGQSVNTTAPGAEALIDLRYPRAEDRAGIMAAIAAIVERSWVPGSSARLDITGEFVPMPPDAGTRALFERYRQAARDLGFEVGAEATGACADSGFAAAAGATTLCGLGPVGGNAHSPAEYVEADTVVPRAQALALTILRLDPAETRRGRGAARTTLPSPDGEGNDPAPPGIHAANHGVTDNEKKL